MDKSVIKERDFSPLGRSSILGVNIDRLTMSESVDKALDLIGGGGCHQHVVVNAAKMVAASEDSTLRSTINSCAMINADGQSVVWASKFLGDPLPERVAGIDFMNALVDASASAGFSIYLLGAKAEVVKSVAEVFTKRGANIAGYHDGYWRSSIQDTELVQKISASGANVLFVAIPSPDKELFLARYLSDLGVNLAVGVGGSFDVVAGLTRRAPVAMQRAGLEWLFRLMQEPRRMFKRYLVGNLKFMRLIVWAHFRSRREV
ncbi:WecB/TagA/CpsF family glycosyltransferase [Arthrobacter sp. ISL-72]|uniref:WecB/TagA/CpsF family glycosyltransferase n=1 Tax=Arthrobacter sp. ISL-72 TaxID=2819114 RepID=UPI001BE4ECEC|nr:WecB/TagA/CpsF family glycosyltransferase [Arthrobacter sp. ISL-72]MBT2596623.1 WecB/TagA/CpsF family glycosyltransferase [Arthrobacter sp. ISL-72]